jgi:hypothetical protein
MSEGTGDDVVTSAGLIYFCTEPFDDTIDRLHLFLSGPYSISYELSLASNTRQRRRPLFSSKLCCFYSTPLAYTSSLPPRALISHSYYLRHFSFIRQHQFFRYPCRNRNSRSFTLGIIIPFNTVCFAKCVKGLAEELRMNCGEILNYIIHLNQCFIHFIRNKLHYLIPGSKYTFDINKT